MSKTYKITLEVTSETNPKEWYFGDTLVIDEEYNVVSVEEA